MTDLIERAASDEDGGVRTGGAATASGAVPTGVDADGTQRRVLAALLAAAGAIHLALAPPHLAESTLEGGGFLAAGWVQVGLAVAVLLRPSRRMLQVAVLASVGLIGAWAVSRTTGLPVGAHAGRAESVSIVDGAAVVLEALATLVAVLVLRRVPLGRLGGRVGAWAVPVMALVLASAAIAAPQARDHAAGGDEDAGGAHGHEGGHGEGGAAGADDDKGLSLLDNGHQHGGGAVELDAATQAELAVQLAPTSALVERYPTVADAEAAGYLRAGPFGPGAGTHYQPPGLAVDTDGVVDPEDIEDPLLVYDGNQPDSPLAGFMYYQGGEEVPEGFVGPNDHWHHHTNVCVVPRADGTIDTPFLADMEDVTSDMCTDVGGSWIDATGYMVHVWTVPGYASDRGVFSQINPAIACPDGTYYTIPPEDVGNRDTTCRNA